MGTSDVALGELTTLFQFGTVGDVDDNQLLDRFLSSRDSGAEAAFAALVERHGPMVLGICRRRLGDPHDAQDAFQTTFLVLVKRAHSIRNQKSVASWLFGVACRVTARAKRDEARRIAKERHAAKMLEALKPVDGPLESWSELYEEVERLPDKYRLPIVLHYFEHMSYEQVAKRVDCPLRTVQTRLARGRERLRSRLRRRGLETSAGLLVAAQTKDVCSLEFSKALAWKLARDASRFASESLSPLVSAKVASWTSGVLRTMIMTKLVSASVVAMAIGGLE
ncbi:sigma-70 family RNA polymerase sigma factor [Singulisphaera sp. Ch08]|uniref:Sigma-70 family RNA polymerase sigma factor n=1 Tax=Singulisphaera sp. Ch08 TaxID=3120278 RepID=A0AAU7CGB1_9BACT